MLMVNKDSFILAQYKMIDNILENYHDLKILRIINVNFVDKM